MNADFGWNVNIAKFVNCSDSDSSINLISPVGVPWRLTVYRNRKKKRRKKCFTLHFVFLDNFYLEGTKYNIRKHFCPNVLPEKRYVFINLVPRGFYFSGIGTAERTVSKSLGKEIDIFMSFDLSCTYKVLQNVPRTLTYESMS